MEQVVLAESVPIELVALAPLVPIELLALAPPPSSLLSLPPKVVPPRPCVLGLVLFGTAGAQIFENGPYFFSENA